MFIWVRRRTGTGCLWPPNTSLRGFALLEKSIQDAEALSSCERPKRLGFSAPFGWMGNRVPEGWCILSVSVSVSIFISVSSKCVWGWSEDNLGCPCSGAFHFLLKIGFHLSSTFLSRIDWLSSESGLLPLLSSLLRSHMCTTTPCLYDFFIWVLWICFTNWVLDSRV